MKRGIVMGFMFTFLLTLSEVGTRSSKLADNIKTGTVQKIAREDEDMADDTPQVPDTGQETNGNYYDKSSDEHCRERDTGKADSSSSEDVPPDSYAGMVPALIGYSANSHRLHRDSSDGDKSDADLLNIARNGGRLITDTSDDMPRKYYRHKDTAIDDVQSRRKSRGQHITKTQSHDNHLNTFPNAKNVHDNKESHLRDDKYENYDTVNEKLAPAPLSNEEMSVDIAREYDDINHKRRYNLRDSDSNLKFDTIDEGGNLNSAKIRKSYLDSRFEVIDDAQDDIFDEVGLRNRDTRKAPKEHNYFDNGNIEYNNNDKEVNSLSSKADAKNELKRHLHSLSPSEISDLFKTFTTEEKNVVEDLLKEDEEDKIHKRELHKDDQGNSIETPKLESSGAITFQDILEKERLDARTMNEKFATLTNFSNPDQLNKIIIGSKYENVNNAQRTDLINKEKHNTLCSEDRKDNLKKFDETAYKETRNVIKLNSKRDIKTLSDNLKFDGELPNVVKRFSSTTPEQEDDTTETASSPPDTEGTRTPTEKISSKDSENEEVKLGNLTVVKRDTHNNKRTANRYSYSPRRYGESEDDHSHIKALENSFPKTQESRSRYFGEDQSGLEPLIRVKRTSRMGKRHAGLMPEARAAYVPYRSEDDEDTDEGSEFDDDGFDDRTSNLAKRHSYYYDAADEQPRYPRGGYANDLVSEFNGYDNSREDYELSQGRAPRYLFRRYKSRPIRGKNPNDRNVHSRGNDYVQGDLKDERNIGSDTDNIFSGVNGADENLMYSGDVRLRRDRRSIRRNKKDNHKTIKRSKLARNTNIDNIDIDLRTNRKSIIRNENLRGLNSLSTDDKNDLPTIIEKGQDSDAFGGLPLNYQSDLNRFKRIRRTKS